jgi:hypothetical protein
MVFSTIKDRQDKKQQEINVREAFTLWDLLRTKYLAIDHAKTLGTNVHDADLRVILVSIIRGLEKDTGEIEKLLKKFSILSPDRTRRTVNFPPNTKVCPDEFIANQLSIFLEANLLNVMKAFRTSVTNDALRNFVKKIILKRVDQLDTMIHYLKLKGWIETPPLFQELPINVKEKITVVEIYHLWHHLTYRYDNMNTTEVMKLFTYDGEYKVTLELGLKTLRKQIAMLEKELTYFGIPLPNAPGVVTFTPGNTEILKDDHMFRTLLDGLQGAALIHLEPLKECTFNDRIRGIFKELFVEELRMIDLYYKYGKLKGWFHPVPMYGSTYLFLFSFSSNFNIFSSCFLVHLLDPTRKILSANSLPASLREAISGEYLILQDRLQYE